MSDTISAGDIVADDGKRYVVVTCPHDSLNPGDEVSMSEAYNYRNIFVRVSDLSLHAIDLNGVYVTVRQLDVKVAESRSDHQDHKKRSATSETRT